MGRKSPGCRPRRKTPAKASGHRVEHRKLKSSGFRKGNAEQCGCWGRYGSDGIIWNSGAAEAGLRRQKTGFVLGLSCAVFGVKTESGRDQTQPCASRFFLAITKLASANRVRSCAVFLARPR